MIYRLLTASIFLFSLNLLGQDNKEQNAKEAEELQLFANGLFERGWYEDAAKEFENLLKKFPKHKDSQEVRYRLYQAYDKLNDKDKTFNALDNFIKNEADPSKKGEALAIKGELLIAAEKYDEAIKTYEAIDAKINNGLLWEQATYQIAKVYLLRGNTDEAFSRFKHLASLEYKGDNQYRAYAIFQYADLLLEKRDLPENLALAIKQFNRLTENGGVPGDLMERIHYKLAVVHFHNRQYEAALNAFDIIITKYPSGIYKESSINGKTYCYLELKKEKEALENLKLNEYATGVIGLERDYLTGYIHQQLKNYQEAIKFYEKCLVHELPNFREQANYNKLECLKELGDFEAVVLESENFIKIYPSSNLIAEVNFIAGKAAFSLNKLEIAEKFLRQALETRVGEWAAVDEVYEKLSEVLRKAEKYEEEAKNWYILAKRENSTRREIAFVEASNAWLRAKKSEEALKLLKEFPLLFPKGKNLLFIQQRVVDIYIFENQLTEAEEFIKSSIQEEDPQNIRHELNFLLAKVKYYKKEFVEAIKLLEVIVADESLKAERKAEMLIFLGYSKLSLEKDIEAEKAFSEAFKLKEDLSKTLPSSSLISLSQLFENYGNISTAKIIYAELSKAEIKKDKMAGMLGLARLMTLAGKYEESLKIFEQVLAMVEEKDLTERVSAMTSIGEIYLKTEKIEQAEQIFNSAMKLNDSNATSRSRMFYGLGQIAYRKKDFDLARRYALQAFVRNNDPYYSPRAMFLAVQGAKELAKKEQAQQIASELKKKFPLYFNEIEVKNYLKEHDINTD